MADWLARINQQQYGPVDDGVLQDWITQGRVRPGDMIWSQGMPNWVRADSIFPADWFREKATPTPPVPPPSPPPIPPIGGPQAHTATQTRTMPTPQRPPAKPHRGVMILIFGLLGLLATPGIVCCFPAPLSLLFSILAWALGNGDLREMRAGRMDPAGMGLTSAGRMCGMIGVTLAIICMFLAFTVFTRMAPPFMPGFRHTPSSPPMPVPW